ncbi:hypothetical protein ABT354_36295 [Streptomyces sp. NPDC000594]|uniref:hypothetical protein n=1 Tax=Streptomyces sp. NPDC000594 TaxID=3154261 RepID=UPI00332B3319
MTTRRRPLGSGPAPQQPQEHPAGDEPPVPAQPRAHAAPADGDDGRLYRPDIPLADLRARGVLGHAPGVSRDVRDPLG